MDLIVFIIVGAVAGFLAGKVMTGHGLGLGRAANRRFRPKWT